MIEFTIRRESARSQLAWALLLAGGALLLIGVSGCTRADLDDYHTVTESSTEPGDAGDHSLQSSIDKTFGEKSPTVQEQPSQAIEVPVNALVSEKPAPVPEIKGANPEPASTISPSPDDDASLQVATAKPEMLRLNSALAGNDSLANPVIPALEAPRQIELLVPHKEFTREGREKALRVTFDDIDLLKVLNMEPVPPNVMDYLPEWLKQLDGQRIVLRGWMFPTGRQEGISRFMFVRDNGICCFGRAPKVYDKLGVTMREGKTTHYIQGRPFDVIGTLTIEADVEGTDVMWLYHLDDALVIEN